MENTKNGVHVTQSLPIDVEGISKRLKEMDIRPNDSQKTFNIKANGEGILVIDPNRVVRGAGYGLTPGIDNPGEILKSLGDSRFTSIEDPPEFYSTKPHPLNEKFAHKGEHNKLEPEKPLLNWIKNIICRISNKNGRR